MVDDKKTVGPKTEDSKRGEPPVTPAENVEGANQYLSDTRQSVVGDNTSSTGGANNPGQHGRDGGEIDGVSNNPAPDAEAIAGEPAAAEPAAAPTAPAESGAAAEPKKL